MKKLFLILFFPLGLLAQIPDKDYQAKCDACIDDLMPKIAASQEVNKEGDKYIQLFSAADSMPSEKAEVSPSDSELAVSSISLGRTILGAPTPEPAQTLIRTWGDMAIELPETLPCVPDVYQYNAPEGPGWCVVWRTMFKDHIYLRIVNGSGPEDRSQNWNLDEEPSKQ